MKSPVPLLNLKGSIAILILAIGAMAYAWSPIAQRVTASPGASASGFGAAFTSVLNSRSNKLAVYGLYNTASLATDKGDYSPGQVVHISGSGFLGNESVQLQITYVTSAKAVASTETGYASGHLPWSVTADSAGNFSADWLVEWDSYGQTLLLTANGASGSQAQVTFTDATSASPDQCRNGSAASPNDCVEAGGGSGWVNGNVGQSQGHYVEGYSIPYRMKIAGVTAGTWTVDIGYDTVHSGAHAIDFLTSYNRINDPLHQSVFNHAPECIDPTDGFLGGIANTGNCTVGGAAPTTAHIPKPIIPDGVVTSTPKCAVNQYPGGAVLTGATQCPGTTYDQINTQGDENMTIWNGHIDSIAYVSQNVVSGQGQQHTRIRVQFTVSATQAAADNGNVLLGYGGHIGRALDWGTLNSAGGISGSPYHMNLEGLCSGTVAIGTPCNDGGAQDRALAAATVTIPTGSITIRKVTVGGDGTFPFSASGAAVGTGTPAFSSSFNLVTATGTAQTSSTEVAIGDTTVTEGTLPAGWAFTSVSCTGTVSPTVVGQAVTIHLAANETATCTFTNTLSGAIKIVKNTIGGNGTFQFNPTGFNGGTSFNLNTVNNTANQTFTNAAPGGSYSISETAQTGWDLTSFTCDHGTIGAIQVLAGQTTTCTATNTKQATIIVKKHMVGGTSTFDFTGHPAGSISVDNGTISESVVPGQYTSTETLKSGWDLSNVTCDDAGSTGSVANHNAVFNVTAGQTVTCTFTNTKQAHLIIDKVTNPSGDAQSFNFTSGLGNFSLTDAATPQDFAVAPGTYSVAESATTGWDLTNLTCSDNSSQSGNTASVTLAAGQTVTCTFTNTKRGSITIVKNTVGGNGTFNFTPVGFGSGAFPLTTVNNTASTTFNNVVPGGTYSISETVPTGWDLTGFTCDHGSIGGITVLAGQTTTCTATNRQQGTITIVKTAVGGNASFPFTGSGGAPVLANFNIATTNGTGQQVFSNVSAGNYTVTEGADLANWQFTGLSCTGNGAGGSTSGKISNIVLAPGGSVTCTYTNTKQGSIKIVKNTTGGDGTFQFNPTGFNSGTSFNLTTVTNTANQTFSNIAPGGTYSITETPQTGWDAVSFTCDNGTTAGITVVAGQTTTCTAVNRKQGTITIVKNTVGGNATFPFTGSGGAPVLANFNIMTTSGTGQQVFSSVSAGNYTVTEGADLTGWQFTSLNCSGNGSGGSTSGKVSNIVLAAGGSVTCTYVNTKQGSIKIVKNTTGGDGTFQFNPTGFNSGTSFNLTTVSNTNSQTFSNLAPGSGYSINETPQTGWDLTSFTCDNGTTAGITVVAGQLTVCTATNVKRGTIRVAKVTNPAGAPGSFGFTGDVVGSIPDGGTISVFNKIPGTYTSTETDPTPGFDLTSISCNDGNSTFNVSTRTATFHLEAGEDVTCTFTNTQRGMAKVIKTVSGLAPTGTDSFTLEIRSGADLDHVGTTVDSGTANAGNVGTINFTAKLVPGATYQICETNMLPGWMTSLTTGGFVPNFNDPNHDNSVVCQNFTVAAGETKTITVDNTPPPGGDARTIGFWKNWSSCTRGAQAPVLDYVLYSFPGPHVNTDLPLPSFPLGNYVPGAPLGNYQVTTCTAAFNILSKQLASSTSKGNRGAAGTASINMAAQLLAAELNVQASANVPACLPAIIAEANSILTAGGYSGNNAGSYTPQQNARMNYLAGLLDAYNNNVLDCSAYVPPGP